MLASYIISTRGHWVLNWGDAWSNAPQCLATILMAHNPLSSLPYPMITYIHLTASNLPTQNLVAEQRPINTVIPEWSLYLATHLVID